MRRQGLIRLPRNKRQRAIASYRRHEKQVPGHQVQVDVKFLTFRDATGRRVRRFQCTAIDDTTRIRALQIYPKYNQAVAICFVDHVVARFPFRIKQIRTDRGHEFQALFHWHIEHLGIEHVYIRPRTPRLNGKVERSHRTDEEEFNQLLTYTDDVDLTRKLEEWERFYNLSRLQGVRRKAPPLTKSCGASYAEPVPLSGVVRRG